MLMRETLVRQGGWLFRWRSYVLFGLAPLFVLAISVPEPIEARFGPSWDCAYEAACIALAFLGLAVRAFTVGHVPAGTSGRNTHGQVAETLNTTGAYSLTRNPLYLGNAIIYMAIALFCQDPVLAVAVALFLVLYLERMIACEEAFLAEKFGPGYLAWARDVPAFFPRLSGWRAAALPFSVRNVLRREYSGFFAIVATFFVIDQARELLVEHRDTADPAWLFALAGGGIVYLALRTLKKQTRLLAVPGR